MHKIKFVRLTLQYRYNRCLTCVWWIYFNTS